MLNLSHKSLILTNRTLNNQNDQLKFRSTDNQYEQCSTDIIKTGEQRIKQAQIPQNKLQYHQIKAMEQ
jgi:hypothetical protein